MMQSASIAHYCNFAPEEHRLPSIFYSSISASENTWTLTTSLEVIGGTRTLRILDDPPEGSRDKFKVDHSKFIMLAKESDDFSRVVTAFYLKLAGIWPAYNPAEERQRRNAFVMEVVLLFLAICVCIRELYFAYGVSFEDTVFTLCNIVTTLLIVIKIMTVSLHKPQFFKLITYMERRFWHTNYDSYEQAFLDKCKHMCIVFICTFNFFAQGTAFSYSLESSVDYFSAANVTTRRLVFDLYTDVVMKPFIFEITLLSQFFVLVACGIGYICVDNFMCISNFHVATQFRILQYRMLNVQKRTEKEIAMALM